MRNSYVCSTNFGCVPFVLLWVEFITMINFAHFAQSPTQVGSDVTSLLASLTPKILWNMPIVNADGFFFLKRPKHASGTIFVKGKSFHHPELANTGSHNYCSAFALSQYTGISQ